MKKFNISGTKKLITFYILFLAIFSSGKVVAQFANGADIGWLSQMEASGYTFYNSNGIQEDCMQILKEKGINSLRFRVWVNPTGGWCGKKDVATMAHRAKNMGFRIMIDFHYSDWWANPGKQNKPAQWLNDSINQLLVDIYNHTYNVLDTLKTLGITPEWVQVGNEVDNGMLWPDGNTSTNMKNFASMIASGYDAVKAIDSTIKVIVHLSSGFNNGLYEWLFDGLKSYGSKWDIIGMSLYPAYYSNPTEWKTMDSLCLSNMIDMKSRYGKEVMICEVGMDYSTPYECNAFLLDIINKTKSISGLGVFYWEPESYNWGYNLGAWDPETKEPTLALDAFLGISHVPPTKISLLNGDAGINVYPNPFTNNINIQYQLDQAETVELVMTDIAGKLSKTVLSPSIQSLGTHTFIVNTGNLPAGLYFLKMVKEGYQSIIQKVIKI